MSVERRKSFVQLGGLNFCTITNPYRQKSFKFKEGDKIDLYSLNRINNDFDFITSPPCPFFIVFEDDSSATIYAVIDLSGNAVAWGAVNLYENPEQAFEGKVWIK